MRAYPPSPYTPVSVEHHCSVGVLVAHFVLCPANFSLQKHTNKYGVNKNIQERDGHVRNKGSRPLFQKYPALPQDLLILHFHRHPHYRGFTMTLRPTTLVKVPLDEWLAGLRILYLTSHNTHNRQTSMPPARFKPAILACEGPHTHALDRTASGIGC